jgi:D-beta-D-heptose 7-phosphate kinase/D-beta-D-heptose 1-phosphate adenosyltransferase
MLPSKAGEPWERKLRTAYLPSLATHVIDPLGCGDALLAAASATLAAGGSLQAAAYLGSLAAAVEAQQLGNRPVSAAQISARMQEPWSTPQATRLAS